MRRRCKAVLKLRSGKCETDVQSPNFTHKQSMNWQPQLSRRSFIAATATASVAGLAKSPSAWAAGAPAYQIGCYTRPWDQFEYRVALDGIAEAGFKHAGIMTAKGKSWVVITVDSTP